MKPLKQANPDLVFGLTGCLAQQEGERLVKRIPYLDFILGPDHIEEIPQAVDWARARSAVLWSGQNSIRKKNYNIPGGAQTRKGKQRARARS